MSFEEIIDNQKKFKDEITKHLKLEIYEAKKDLFSIDTKDKSIKKEVDKWKKKVEKKWKSKKVKNYISRLFFMHPRRNKVYFAYWDIINESVLIKKYEERENQGVN